MNVLWYLATFSPVWPTISPRAVRRGWAGVGAMAEDRDGVRPSRPLVQVRADGVCLAGGPARCGRGPQAARLNGIRDTLI